MNVATVSTGYTQKNFAEEQVLWEKIKTITKGWYANSQIWAW